MKTILFLSAMLLAVAGCSLDAQEGTYAALHEWQTVLDCPLNVNPKVSVTTLGVPWGSAWFRAERGGFIFYDTGMRNLSAVHQRQVFLEAAGLTLDAQGFLPSNAPPVLISRLRTQNGCE